MKEKKAMAVFILEDALSVAKDNYESFNVRLLVGL